MYGEWRTRPQQYLSEIATYRDIGKLDWVAPQDWMCEPWLLKKTGLTIEEHQQRTVDSFLYLWPRSKAWVIPVLQGWELRDYVNHVEMYRKAGVDLLSYSTVGLGSVCRRQAMPAAVEIVQELARMGLRLHGFGVKLQGLEQIGHLLTSADSMAWSFNARREYPLEGCWGHINCANCPRYAYQWREKLAQRLGKVWS